MADVKSKSKTTRAGAIRRKDKPEARPKVHDFIQDVGGYKEEPRGERFSICARCGKRFEQIFYREQNRYAGLRHCQSCLSARGQKVLESRRENKFKQKENEETLVTLPFQPFEWQKKAMEGFETHRFVVIAAANRSGKDRASVMMGIKYFIELLSENRHVNHPEMVPSVQWWQIAPTEKIARQNWRELKQYFPKEFIVRCSDSDYVMSTIGNGVIEVRSAHDPEALVGTGLDLVTITEAARIRDLKTVWANLEARLNSPGTGRQKDKRGKDFGVGKAIINSSPIGRGYFYEMFKFGQKGSDFYSSNWISYQVGWRDNPMNAQLADEIVHTRFGDMTYEEDLRRKIGERLFRQNYLADFLALDGTVFKRFDECVEDVFNMGMSKSEREEYIRQWKEPVSYHDYRIGYDPATGSSADSPAVIVRDMSTNRIVLVLDLMGKNYDQQWDEIALISRRYNYAPCAWLRTGHTAVENQLAKRGVLEIPLNEQGGKKAEYIQSLERAVENLDIRVIQDGSDEMQRFIAQMTDYTEKDGKYSNLAEAHDDFVSACYAAYFDYSVSEMKVAYCGRMSGVHR